MAVLHPDTIISDVCTESHTVELFSDFSVADPLFPPLDNSNTLNGAERNIFNNDAIGAQGDISDDLINSMLDKLSVSELLALHMFQSAPEARMEGVIPTPEPTPDVQKPKDSHIDNPCTPKKAKDIPLG